MKATVKIDGGRLKHLRNGKGWTLKQLEGHIQAHAGKASKNRDRRSNRSEPVEDTIHSQTIHEIEVGKRPRLRLSKAEIMAEVLGVSLDELTGTAAMPAQHSDVVDENWPSLKHLRISRRAHNELILTARRYQVPPSWIAAIAPLAVRILAEQSLRARAQWLDTFAAKQAELVKAGESMPHIGAVVFYPRIEGEEIIEAERESLAARDLFGRGVLEADEAGPAYDLAEVAPFLNFLREEAARLGIAVDADDSAFFTRRFPVLHNDDWEDARLFADGDSDLATAVASGWVLLKEMPAALREDNSGAKRADWVRARIKTDPYAVQQSESHRIAMDVLSGAATTPQGEPYSDGGANGPAEPNRP